jgi:hypothetical protein
MVHFLLELKEVKSLFDPWKKWYPVLKAFNRYKAIYPIIRKKGLFSPKEIANLHLGYKFGWKPFLSDVMRIKDSLDDFRKKVRDLQKNANQPIRRHYSRPLDLAILSPLASVLYSDSVTTVSRETKWVIKPKYNATVDFVYSMPDMSRLVNQVAGFADSLGFHLNPQIAWNAIPYSFVVDWFFDVGGFLNRLRADNLVVPATVVSFVHSIKWKHETMYWLVGKPTQVSGGDPHCLMARRVQLRYERRRDIPSWGLDTTVRIPNMGQVLLGTSLITQKFGSKYAKSKPRFNLGAGA